MAPLIDLTGRRFGKLTVVSVAHRAPDRTWHWNCVCDCGNFTASTGRNLKSSKSKSCGCVRGIRITHPITHEQLLKILHYDVDDGFFRWRVEGRSYLPGDVAGHTNHHNVYVRINIEYKSYQAHQLAWFYMTGEWADTIDHRDTDTRNNRWNNLRKATASQNLANSSLTVRNTTGFKGVSIRYGKFRATCRGKDIGNFGAAEEAARAYDTEARKQFGEFARTNFGTKS